MQFSDYVAVEFSNRIFPDMTTASFGSSLAVSFFTFQLVSLEVFLNLLIIVIEFTNVTISHGKPVDRRAR